MKNTDNNIQDLINKMTNSPDQFNHLKIFMSRSGKIDYPNANEFLMVTPNVFGKVKVLDLGVIDDIITIEFMDCVTKAVGSVCVDINKECPDVLLFICWSDVKDCVFADMMASNDDSELLELYKFLNLGH